MLKGETHKERSHETAKMLVKNLNYNTTHDVFDPNYNPHADKPVEKPVSKGEIISQVLGWVIGVFFLVLLVNIFNIPIQLKAAIDGLVVASVAGFTKYYHPPENDDNVNGRYNR